MQRDVPNDEINDSSLLDHDEFELEAAQWVVILDRDDCSDDDQKRFEQWISQSDDHRVAFMQLQMLNQEMASLQALDTIGEDALELATQPRVQNEWRNALFALAATVLIAIGAVTLFMGQRSTAIEFQEYITATGEQETITLSDGSSAFLNTNTRLTVTYSRDQRQLHVHSGEAFFSVEKDADRPFTVEAADHSVQAVGTSFSVRLKEDRSVEVAVEEGIVAVLPDQRQSSSPKGLSEASKMLSLTRGQVAYLSESEPRVQDLSETALERKNSWKRGVLSYSNARLSEVVLDVSRYTNIEIEIADPSLNDLPIGGFIRVGQIEQFFELLELSFGLHVERISNQKVRIHKQGPQPLE